MLCILVVPKSINMYIIFDLAFDTSLIEGDDLTNLCISVLLYDWLSGGAVEVLSV